MNDCDDDDYKDHWPVNQLSLVMELNRYKPCTGIQSVCTNLQASIMDCVVCSETKNMKIT